MEPNTQSYRAAKRTEIAERRAKVSELYRKNGWTVYRIARELGCSVATVSEDLQALIDGWKRTAAVNTLAHIATELEKINCIEVEAWSAYESSKKPRRSASARKVTSVVDGEPVETTVTAATEIYPVTGNEKFLARVAWCVDERIKLLGLAKGDIKDDEENEKYPTTFTGWMALEFRKREAEKNNIVTLKAARLAAPHDVKPLPLP